MREASRLQRFHLHFPFSFTFSSSVFSLFSFCSSLLFLVRSFFSSFFFFFLIFIFLPQFVPCACTYFRLLYHRYYDPTYVLACMYHITCKLTYIVPSQVCNTEYVQIRRVSTPTKYLVTVPHHQTTIAQAFYAQKLKSEMYKRFTRFSTVYFLPEKIVAHRG